MKNKPKLFVDKLLQRHSKKRNLFTLPQNELKEHTLPTQNNNLIFIDALGDSSEANEIVRLSQLNQAKSQEPTVSFKNENVIYCDAFGDPSLQGVMSSLAQKFGRNDDLLEISFTTSDQDQIGAQDIKVLKHERPLFEANYIKLGGKLHYLKWEECDNRVGSYQVDREAISEAAINDSEFDAQIREHAEHVTSCLGIWLECAKSKAIPDGYYLMPIQPDEEMLKQAKIEFEDLGIENIEDRIVFSHQAMIQARPQPIEKY